MGNYGFRGREKTAGRRHYRQGVGESPLHWSSSSSSYARNSKEDGLPGQDKIRKDCDEVFPQIMVGTGDCIKDLDYLLDLGITHIINTSEQDVRIDPTKFAKQGICYKGFICKDMPG